THAARSTPSKVVMAAKRPDFRTATRATCAAAAHERWPRTETRRKSSWPRSGRTSERPRGRHARPRLTNAGRELKPVESRHGREAAGLPNGHAGDMRGRGSRTLAAS